MTAETASGGYRYLLNGERVDIEEHWSVVGAFGGNCQISSWRRAPGVHLQVEASIEQGRVKAFAVTWSSDAAPHIHAAYVLRNDCVEVLRSVGSEEARRDELPFVGTGLPLLSPLMRIFAGPVIGQLLAQGGEGDVVVPYIGDPETVEKLLAPRMSQREARLLAADVNLERDGQIYPCRLCEYTGDQYAPGTRFYLDADNRLLRYQWQQDAARQWDVWMVAS